MSTYSLKITVIWMIEQSDRQREVDQIYFRKCMKNNLGINNWNYLRIYSPRLIRQFQCKLTILDRGGDQVLRQRILTFFEKGSITVLLTYRLTGLEPTKQVNLLSIQHKLNHGWPIKQEFSGTAESECSLSQQSTTFYSDNLNSNPAEMIWGRQKLME